MVDIAALPDPAIAGMTEDFFANYLTAVAEPIVPRLDSELISDARHHSDPAVREHAALEFLARHGKAAFATILSLWSGEEDIAVRQSLFEELTTLDKSQFGLILHDRGLPRDLLQFGIVYYGMEAAAPPRVVTDEVEPFDQIIPLRITLKEFVEVEPNIWKYHVFAPIQETRVAGQLYACSIVETRDQRIALTKQLKGLHSDGTLHLENTLFNGRTVYMDELTRVGSYRTAMPVPFYPSGRIGDQSEGIIPDALVPVDRVAMLSLTTEIMIRGHPAIRNVTGMIRAWGYTRPDRATFDASGRMDQVAGLFHLGSLIDPRTRDYVNTYTVGVYRGLLTPDAAGLIGLNTSPSYMTVDGEIDRNRDGIPDIPGQHYDICPDIYPIEHYLRREENDRDEHYHRHDEGNREEHRPTHDENDRE